MSPAPQLTDHELAHRLVRWLGIIGIVWAAICLLNYVSIVWRWPFFPWPLRTVHLMLGLAGIITVVSAAALLIVGSVAMIRMKSWARPILLVYVGLTIGGELLIACSGMALIFEVRSRNQIAWPTGQAVAMLASLVFSAINHSIFPAILLVCVFRLNLLNFSATPRGAFEPIFPKPVDHP